MSGTLPYMSENCQGICLSSHTPLSNSELGAGAVAAADAWRVTIEGEGLGNPAQAETLLALANGALGVRGGREEAPTATDGALMAGVYEQVPIHYHEAFPGFARHSDTRVPVADGKRIRVQVGKAGVDLSRAAQVSCRRELDLRGASLSRVTRWRLAGVGEFEVRVVRFVPLQQGARLLIRFELHSIDFSGPVQLLSSIEASRGLERSDDPRIGSGAGVGLVQQAAGRDADTQWLVQTAPVSGRAVAVAQAHLPGPGLAPAVHAAGAGAAGVCQAFTAVLSPGASVRLEKFVSWFEASHEASREADPALAAHTARADRDLGFDALLAQHVAAWQAFWDQADLGVDGDPALDQALHFNLFHLRQSAPADGRHGLAAKGLTGEGYEGHAFWDTEAFALPVLQMVAPELAQASLQWRAATLQGARRHARELDHRRGALYPWRTIAGDEGSAYFPSGSAQYHINAAIAFALRLHALGQEGLLAPALLEVLFETARLWLEVGHFSARRGGAFCIQGVTGPDEYSALVDNDHYTNRMAQRHLEFAAAQAQRLASEDPETYRQLAARIGLQAGEPARWQAAAQAMWLAVDERTGVHPQDDAFLGRPFSTLPSEPGSHRPLLLRVHPLTLYRHQVCKQPSVVLADVLAGEDISREQKARNYRYYEPITVHDSSLSGSTWAVMAAELGRLDEAMAYLRGDARLDLDDRHGNASHGAHMAAMAGTWLGLAWGLGGLRVAADGSLRLAPRLPPDLQGYRFSLQWRGALLRVRVSRQDVEYRIERGVGLAIWHGTERLELVRGEAQRVVLSAPPALRVASTVDAVIFDLDGVLADTAELHFVAWQEIATELGLRFDRAVNESLKGIDRLGSIDLILAHNGITLPEAERQRLATRKNERFKALVAKLDERDLPPGAREALEAARRAGVRIALASASRNAPEVIRRLGIEPYFDAVADPTAGAPKPAPDVFLAAARAVGADPRRCVGVEDAAAGVQALKAAGMFAIGVGDPQQLGEADIVVPGMVDLGLARFLSLDRNWSPSRSGGAA